MNSPRNVIAIDRLQSGSIVGLRKLSKSCVSVSSVNSWESIPIKVPARLTISDKIDDGVRLYAAQLVFRTCEEPIDIERMVYRCKTADGRYYLIGNNDRPYPVTTVNDTHPDNMRDSQLYEVNVNYTSACKIPYIQ
jgi:hypothetical protein